MTNNHGNGKVESHDKWSTPVSSASAGAATGDDDGPLAAPDEAEEEDTSTESAPDPASVRGAPSVDAARSAPGTTTPTTVAVTTVELYFQRYPGTQTTGGSNIGIDGIPATVSVNGAPASSVTTDADGRIQISMPAGARATVHIFDTDYEVTARSTLEAVTTVAGQQRRLNALGYDLGAHGVDGHRGSKTEAAVLDFQADANERINGVANSATRTALQSADWMGE
jgi:hypothetical protein